MSHDNEQPGLDVSDARERLVQRVDETGLDAKLVAGNKRARSLLKIEAVFRHPIRIAGVSEHRDEHGCLAVVLGRGGGREPAQAFFRLFLRKAGIERVSSRDRIVRGLRRAGKREPHGVEDGRHALRVSEPPRRSSHEVQSLVTGVPELSNHLVEKERCRNDISSPCTKTNDIPVDVGHVPWWDFEAALGTPVALDRQFVYASDVKVRVTCITAPITFVLGFDDDDFIAVCTGV
jgi:hypothetical protein